MQKESEQARLVLAFAFVWSVCVSHKNIKRAALFITQIWLPVWHSETVSVQSKLRVSFPADSCKSSDVLEYPGIRRRDKPQGWLARRVLSYFPRIRLWTYASLRFMVSCPCMNKISRPETQENIGKRDLRSEPLYWWEVFRCCGRRCLLMHGRTDHKTCL